jgi:hypothetical protein
MLEQESGRESAAIDRLLPLLDPPAHSDAIRELVRLLDKLGRATEARALCTRVLEHDPHQAAAHAALGFLLLKREFCPKQALTHFSLALEYGMVSDDLLSNMGIALQDLGRLDQAIASYDRALLLNADHRPARFHRALALLLQGQFEQAWPDYELRLDSEDVPPPPRRLPLWKGENVGDRPVLVYGEQGIGDEMMFASCLPDVLRTCSHTVIACTKKLESLFRRSFPAAQVMTLDRARELPEPVALRNAAAMIPMGSLPLHFRRSRDRFPQHDGYLRPDRDLEAGYRARLQALGPGLKVGVSWRGGTTRSRQALRTLGRENIERLLDIPSVQFIDLQYDSTAAAPDVAKLITHGKLLHWPEALADYECTAALVACLDLVVSVCTAVVHLAGALGRPVWIMAPYSPEWRYGIDGERMPWYPSARIIRQSSPGDWGSVIDSVCGRLHALNA